MDLIYHGSPVRLQLSCKIPITLYVYHTISISKNVDMHILAIMLQLLVVFSMITCCPDVAWKQ